MILVLIPCLMTFIKYPHVHVYPHVAQNAHLYNVFCFFLKSNKEMHWPLSLQWQFVTWSSKARPIPERQIKSNQIKSLLLSHHHSTSALVSEILTSVLQTVQKKNNNKQFTYGQTSAKKTNTLHMDRQCKKNNKQFTYGQTVQKNNKQFTYGQTVQKKQQTIYIWTDSAKNLHWSIYSAPDSEKKKKTIYIWTVHIYRLYRRQYAKTHT